MSVKQTKKRVCLSALALVKIFATPNTTRHVPNAHHTIVPPMNSDCWCYWIMETRKLTQELVCIYGNIFTFNCTVCSSFPLFGPDHHQQVCVCVRVYAFDCSLRRSMITLHTAITCDWYAQRWEKIPFLIIELYALSISKR